LFCEKHEVFQAQKNGSHFALTSVELLGVRPKSPSNWALGYALLHISPFPLLNDENVFSDCPEFRFAVEIVTAFAFSPFPHISRLIFLGIAKNIQISREMPGRDSRMETVTESLRPP
jgi:hypothetical protein